MGVPARQHAPAAVRDDEPLRDTSPDVESDAAGATTATAAAHAAIAAESEREGIPDRERSGPAAEGGDHEPPEPAAKAGAAPAGKGAGKTIVLGGGIHVVAAGETLKTIASEHYGRTKHWTKIKQANRDKVGRGNRVAEGTVLRIPEVEVDTLSALQAFQDRPDRLRDVVVMMPDEQYEGFIAGLSGKQLDQNARLLQVAEMNRAAGMTLEELIDEQRRYMEGRAVEEGKTVAQHVAGVAERAKSGVTPVSAQPYDEKADKAWRRRFEAAVKKVRATAPPDVLDTIKHAEAQGGGFRWSPAEAARLGAFGFTRDGSWELHCGTEWVKRAEANVESVWGNIVHEMGGHNRYGASVGQQIIRDALSPDEMQEARQGGSVYMAYGYLETEIFGELYEYPHNYPDDGPNRYPTDTAFDTDRHGNRMNNEPRKDRGDVIDLLEKMKAAFAPRVAHALVMGLARRVAIDPRIHPDAKDRFSRSLLHVFGTQL